MSAGRPIEFDPEVALNAAMRLFWAQGYAATSLQELLVRMGIARSSFYQTFHGKHEVFLRALEHYRDGLVVELRAQLAAADSALDFLNDTLASVADDARGRDGRRGCLVFNSAAEFGQCDPEVAAQVSTAITAFTTVFADAIRQAQREGDIDPGRDPVLLGKHMVCSMSGLRTLAKAGAKRRELIQLAELAVPKRNGAGA